MLRMRLIRNMELPSSDLSAGALAPADSLSDGQDDGAKYRSTRFRRVAQSGETDLKARRRRASHATQKAKKLGDRPALRARTTPPASSGGMRSSLKKRDYLAGRLHHSLVIANNCHSH